MPCTRPTQAWKSRFLKENGKHLVSFSDVGYSDNYDPISLPCGVCDSCRLSRARSWAIRCMHEAKKSKKSCFITLTFSDVGLLKRYSEDGVNPYTLHLPDFQKFMKRLRSFFSDNYDVNGIRFFHCAEYGSKLGRPHYHALLYNVDFPDKEFFKFSGGNKLYVSTILSHLWPYGYSTVGSVSYESAAYCARYCLKKVNGKLAAQHYELIDCDMESGEVRSVIDRKPEYCTMSRRGGIGKSWFESFSSDVYPSDQIVVPDMGIFKPPRYYDSLYEVANPEGFATVKAKRLDYFKNLTDFSEMHPCRLAVKAKVVKARLDLYKRSL